MEVEPGKLRVIHSDSKVLSLRPMLQRRAASRGGVKGPTGTEIGLGGLGLKFLWGGFQARWAVWAVWAFWPASPPVAPPQRRCCTIITTGATAIASWPPFGSHSAFYPTQFEQNLALQCNRFTLDLIFNPGRHLFLQF
jgi:hypothetical protein